MRNIQKLLALCLCCLCLFSSALPAFASGDAAVAAALPFENSAFFTTGAYRIHYRVFPADNPRGQIFMIHGFALSSYCFEALAKEMASRIRAYAPLMRAWLERMTQ